MGTSWLAIMGTMLDQPTPVLTNIQTLYLEAKPIQMATYIIPWRLDVVPWSAHRTSKDENSSVLSVLKNKLITFSFKILNLFYNLKSYWILFKIFSYFVKNVSNYTPLIFYFCDLGHAFNRELAGRECAATLIFIFVKFIFFEFSIKKLNFYVTNTKHHRYGFVFIG